MSNANSPLYQFEAIADLYYRRFHRLAPGKSEAPESYRDSNDDENRAQFAAWRASNDCFMDAIKRIIALDEKVEDLQRQIDELS
jgi:hypothetical protein